MSNEKELEELREENQRLRRERDRYKGQARRKKQSVSNLKEGIRLKRQRMERLLPAAQELLLSLRKLRKDMPGAEDCPYCDGVSCPVHDDDFLETLFEEIKAPSSAVDFITGRGKDFEDKSPKSKHEIDWSIP